MLATPEKQVRITDQKPGREKEKNIQNHNDIFRFLVFSHFKSDSQNPFIQKISIEHQLIIFFDLLIFAAKLLSAQKPKTHTSQLSVSVSKIIALVYYCIWRYKYAKMKNQFILF